MSSEQMSVLRFELLMDAGFGAQKAGDILISAFATMGTSVYIEPMIPAEISPPPRSRPALSGVNIRVADFSLSNIGNDTDLMLAQHEVVLDRRLDDEEFNENCKVLLDMGDQKANEEAYEQVLKRSAKLGLQVIPFTIADEALDIMKQLAGRGRNMYYMGILGCVFNVPQELIIDQIKKTFGKKLPEEILNKNIDIFKCAYEKAQSEINFSFTIADRKRTGQRIMMDGNTSIAMGLIDAGMKFFSGYPITPASSIMHTLARQFPSYGGMVHQAEDELAAIGTALGGYYGGTPSVTCTSGPGLSLKQEFLGYAAMAEIPLVIVDAQRSGPSTGMPTKTEQSDLDAAIFGSHGDPTKIVLSVGSIPDCFYAPHVARYLAEKLRMPVFIMTDFHIANSYKVIDKLKTYCLKDINDIPDAVLERFNLERLPDEIEMVRTNQANPGTPGKMRRITGLNTDEEGNINYFSQTNQRSHEVRNEKIHHVRRALKEPEMFGEIEGGEVLVVGWGSAKGAMEEAVLNLYRQKMSVAGMHLKVVYPLPLHLKDIFKRFKHVVTVESAYGDPMKKPPLARLLRNETVCDVQSIICRATGRPIRPIGIERKIKELLA